MVTKERAVLKLPGDVRVEYIQVTPDLAAQWLGRNKKNRNIRVAVVQGLAEAELRGEWQLNGETIKIDWDGNLLDGQHRLTSIVKSGMTLPCLVVTGLDPAVLDTIDQGLKRQFADYLVMEGQKYAAGIAATTRLLWQFENKKLVIGRDAKQPTIIQLRDCLAANLDLLDVMPLAYALNDELGLARSMAAFTYLLCRRKSRDAADEFFDQLRSGSYLEEGDAIWILRRHLLKARMDQTRKIRPEVKGAWIIKQWNAWRKGKGLKVMRLNVGDEFPKPI